MNGKIDPNKEIEKALLNIRKFRELKNITREQMASDLELSASGYSKIERGEIELSLSRLFQIAEALEVDIAQILNFDVQNIFHITGNKSVLGLGYNQGGTYNNYPDSYMEKYIQKLEEENARLKDELAKLRSLHGG
jgi:transcriptional regulator with XRE-family HTH domain